MDANVCDKDHNPTNCYLTVTTRIVFDRAAEENAGHRSDEIAGDAHAPSLLFCGDFGGPTGEIAMKTTNRQLMWLGMLLFLLGLLTGLAEQRFTNVRMGLAAHLEGVMNGIFLVALGAIWTEVKLPSPAKVMAYWTALYGTYANWLTTTLAAVFG